MTFRVQVVLLYVRVLYSFYIMQLCWESIAMMGQSEYCHDWGGRVIIQSQNPQVKSGQVPLSLTSIYFSTVDVK